MSINNKLAELSKSELAQKLQSAYGTAKRYRAEAKHATQVGMRSIVTTAGGALGGQPLHDRGECVGRALST